MVTFQGMFAVMSVFSLVIFVPLGLVRFAVDWWRFQHAANTANAHLNYNGLGIAADGIILSAICFCVFFLMELRFKRKIRRRSG